MKRWLLLGLALVGCTGQGEERSGSCTEILPHWRKPADGVAMLSVTNSISIKGQRLFWNEKQIDEQTLIDYSKRMPGLNPPVHLQFDPTGSSSCSYARKIRDIIDKNAKCSDLPGICGQGSQCEWENAPEISDVIGPEGPSKIYPPKVACN